MRFDFRRAFATLIERSAATRTAVMCAETPWWKCHRRLISDRAALLADAAVVHLVSGRAMPHRLTPGVVSISRQDLLYAAE